MPNAPDNLPVPLKPIPVKVRRVERPERPYRPGDFTEAMLSASNVDDGMEAVIAILMSGVEARKAKP